MIDDNSKHGSSQAEEEKVVMGLPYQVSDKQLEGLILSYLFGLGVKPQQGARVIVEMARVALGHKREEHDKNECKDKNTNDSETRQSESSEQSEV